MRYSCSYIQFPFGLEPVGLIVAMSTAAREENLVGSSQSFLEEKTESSSLKNLFLETIYGGGAPTALGHCARAPLGRRAHFLGKNYAARLELVFAELAGKFGVNESGGT